MLFQVYSTYLAVTAAAILLGECNREPATEFTARFVDEEILFLQFSTSWQAILGAPHSIPSDHYPEINPFCYRYL
jgi:hypothetical protein